jgi:hypothetical protein
LLSDPIPWLIIFIQDVHSFVKVCDICLDAMSWIYNPLNLEFTNGPPTHYHFNEFILNQMALSEFWSYRYLFLTMLFCQSFCSWGFMLVKVCDICLDAMSWIYNPLNLEFTNGPPTHYHFNEFILNQMPLSELWSYRYLFLTILFCQSFCPWGFMLVLSYITRGHAY